MLERRYVTEKEVAKVGDFSVQTLRNWRHLGKGPAYHKIGRAIRYSETDVIQFMESRKIIPGNGE
jgi:predicted DNA-binding transcriptional regulator AlpA